MTIKFGCLIQTFKNLIPVLRLTKLVVERVMTEYTDLQQSTHFLVEKVMILSLLTEEMILWLEIKGTISSKGELEWIIYLVE